MLLIHGTTRVRPRKLAELRFICPHEKMARTAELFEYLLMVSFFFVPLIPVCKLRDWQCSFCGKRVVDNTGGSYHRLILARNLGCGLVGLLMLAIFVGLVINLPSIIAPGMEAAARWFFGLFAFLGLIVLIFTAWDTFRVSKLQALSGRVEDADYAKMAETVQDGDQQADVEKRLAARGFSQEQTQAFIHRWAQPES
jgi:hypothetical protein